MSCFDCVIVIFVKIEMIYSIDLVLIGSVNVLLVLN